MIEAVPSEPDQTSDEAIVARVVAGERSAYAELLRRHNQRVYRVARSIVRDDAEAEDVVQDAYVRAYEHLAEFAGRSSWVTWLTRIAVHEALARVRRREREAGGEDAMAAGERRGLETPQASPEQVAGERELAKVLELAIDALPEAFRTVFVLREVEGLSTHETAASLELNDDTVKTRLHRAKRLLRRELESHVGATSREAFALHAPRCERIVAAAMERIAALPAPQDRR